NCLSCIGTRAREDESLQLEVMPVSGQSVHQIAPLRQVRFRRPSGGYRCVTDRELDAQDPRNDPDTDVSRADLFWSVRDEAAGERLLALLARYGIPFTPRGNIEFPNEKKEFDAEVSYTIDRSILRAIAKIALNYLAKMSGCQDF